MTITVETLAAIGRAAGLCALGVCGAEPFVDTAAVLSQRKQQGLHATMQFTYRNPDRSTDPARLVPGATALVVGALEFGAAGFGPPDDGRPYARVAAYARSDHYARLRDGLEAVAAPLRATGHRAVVTADENSLVDRAAAHRAGIGWWGKNSNILVPGAGSLVVLGSVVTDAPIAGAGAEAVPDGCGPCRRCLDGCPTGAIIAPGTLDARRCLAWLVQQDGVFDPDYRVALEDRIYGCDDCSDVCPPNRITVARQRRREVRPAPRRGSERGLAPDSQPSQNPRSDGRPEPEPQPGSRPRASVGREVGGTRRSEPESQPGSQQESCERGWASILDMLDASDEQLTAEFGRWYIPRREPRYLRRNALVVLGNVGDASDPRVRAAVDRALADPDPLVRAHAVWCARRLGLGLHSLTGGDHPLVSAELQRAVPLRSAS